MFKLPEDFTTKIEGGSAKVIDAFSLSKGDIYWESSRNFNLKCIVTSEPVTTDSEDCEDISWEAATWDGEVLKYDVPFLVTVGEQYYGPTLYTSAAHLFGHNTEKSDEVGLRFSPWEEVTRNV